MIRLALSIWLATVQLGFSQTVAVKSGDHPGFTRLVLELPQPTEWQVGRTAEGYELRIVGENLRFDVTRVFDEIQRNRIAAIWMDPKTGGLRIGIACACYALPFEFRPGIIVIDLRDGPPPKGSSFELALDSPADSVGEAELAARPTLRPRARPRTEFATHGHATPAAPNYDWLASSEPRMIETEVPETAFEIVEQRGDIGPLKDALLRQLSRGAAQGVVQMQQPSLSARNSGDPLPVGPRANIHLGVAPGFDVMTKQAPEGTLIEDGADCIAEENLDLSGWANDQPFATQLSDGRADLIGEFDKADEAAVAVAAKLFIHFGFGAEAQQLLNEMPVNDADAVLWKSMAKLVDGQPDPTGPFKNMQTCDTAAALWASMALPQLNAAEKPRSDAVLRTFFALPGHLRQNLGPDLAAKFLAIDDLATARSISSAVRRSVAEAGPEIALMKASIDFAAGDVDAAGAQLEALLPDAGPVIAETLIAMVDAQIASGEAVDPETPIALAAMLREQIGSDLEPALRRAQILALASSGDFDQAFELLPEMAAAEPDLWELLAKSGSDTAILNHAVLPQDAGLPDLAAAERGQIAAHLQALGLSDAALRWIGPMSNETSHADRILAATASLSTGDATTGLAWIDGLEDSAASDLRAKALSQLGRLTEAAQAWQSAGNTDAALRAQSWARNWDELSISGASSWQAATRLVVAGTGEDVQKAPGSLALGLALVADSAAARATLTTLLQGVPGPRAED
jgi:tetratricopeptide (TPR) repeat protein